MEEVHCVLIEYVYEEMLFSFSTVMVSEQAILDIFQ